jgi:anti-anti-sigma regulatory factor
MAQKDVSLSGVVTIAKAEALHHEFEAAMLDGLSINIDASELERADTSIMQLLCTLKKQMQQSNMQSLSIKGSDALDQYIRLLGLDELKEFSTVQ